MAHDAAERLSVLSVPSQELERPASKASWLCRDDADRERMIDMEDRLRPCRQRAFAILAVAIASVGPWVGWWPLLFLIPALVFFAAASQLLSRVARPELVMFAAWIGSELAIAGAISLEGGARVAALSWLAIPVITLSSRFSLRGIIAGVTIAGALVLIVGLGIDTSLVVHSPALLIAPLALILCVAVLSTPLMHSDIQHRSDAVIDQLTGMLNRKALGARSHELAQQSQVTGEPVGLIVADVDHFKRVNDTRGHDAGDIVLKEVAYVLRKQLRAFDLAYRLGGEEFLILVPGSDLEHTAELAERLRAAIAANLISGGLSVTMSLGVSGSPRDERFDYPAVFAKADAALYRAKRDGRNRVSIADHNEDDTRRAMQAETLRPAGGEAALA
jgi:diguanylate cyclase (GGDEF)-like protein